MEWVNIYYLSLEFHPNKYNIVLGENPFQDELDKANEGNIYHENLKK